MVEWLASTIQRTNKTNKTNMTNMTNMTYQTYKIFSRWAKRNSFNLKVALAVLLATGALAGLAGGLIWWRIYSFSDVPLGSFGGESLAGDTNVPDTYDKPLLIKLADLALSIAPLGANAAQASAEKNVVKYADAFNNTDIVQTRYFNKIKEDIILKSPGHPEVFEYEVDLSSYDVSRDSPGNLYFFQKGHKDDNQYLRFSIPAPFLIDASGRKSSVQDVFFELKSSGRLVLKPSAKWLAKAKYPVVLDPTIEINVLTVHSHPQQGDNWTVDFTTQGTADLKIIPTDQATIDDDEFVSLSCGGQNLQPQILAGDVIYYPNWNCSEIGQVVHYTKKAGNHTLKFDFGGQTAYAYNNACTFCATGGTITYSGNYTIHTFTTSGILTVTGSGNVEVLVVAGGGGGGGDVGGGGGAGGLKYSASTAVASGNITVTVGGGGDGGSGVYPYSNGGNGGGSAFGSLSSTGGGGGGRKQEAGNAGGSGGGGGANGLPGGSGIAGEGNDGSAGIPYDSGGGGGGKGSAASGGNAGSGYVSTISGASVTYAAGGGANQITGANGGANTGNGGLGTASGGAGTAGGSGIVIVRYIPGRSPIIFRTAATDAYTKLLIHANEASGSTTLIDSESVPKTITANGNASTTSAYGKFGNSAAFDGTGDYLFLADNDDFDFGTGNFTIDFWFKTGTASQNILGKNTGPASYLGWYFYMSGGTMEFYDNGNTRILNGLIASLDDNNWHHVAVVRNEGVSSLYIDGILDVSASQANSDNTATSLIIGTYYVDGAKYTGYLDEIRISKGIARWTANFTPPASAYSSTGSSLIFRTAATDVYTKLLLHADGAGASFVDSESIPKTITASGNATQSATQSKFGGKSAYFDGGSTDYLTVADHSDFDFGAGDFTVDFWMNTGVASQNVLGKWYSPGWYFQLSSGAIQFVGNSNTVVLSGGSGLNDNGWHHVAVARSGSTAYLFVDGALAQQVSYSVNEDNGNDLAIGRIGPGSGLFTGYLDEIRISKGIARWTSALTPPTSAYSSTGSAVIFK